MFTLFGRKKHFVFDIAIDTRPFEADLPKEAVEIIRKFHRKQKRTFERFASDILVKCKRDFNTNYKKLKTSCLELSVLYYHFFSNEFEKMKVDSAVSKLYFAVMFNNFRDMHSVLEDLNYRDLNDFIRIKDDYYKHVHETKSRLELSHYYYHTFVRFPLMKPEDYQALPPYFDYIDSRQNYIYFLDTTARIRKEAEEFARSISNIKTVHMMSPAAA